MIVMITNTIVPYCYDIAHILGLPSCLSHRFRYRAKWIKLSYEAKGIKNQDGLIVLRNFRSGNLMPIRYVRIQDVLTDGDINYIEFQLGNYFPVGSTQRARDEIAEVLWKKGFENKGGEELECLVFDVSWRAKIEENENWDAILREIGGIDCYKDFGFLKVLHVWESDGRSACVTLDETGKYSLALRPNTLYFLDVLQHVPWEIDKKESIDVPYDVELKTETDEVTILRKIQRVVGKYDLLRFIFKTPFGYSVKHTFLEIENKQSGELAKYRLPALFLPIRVEPPGWMKAVLYLRIALGVLAVVAVVGAEPLARKMGIGADWIRALSLLFLVLATGKWDEAVAGIVKETKEARLK